MSIIPLLLATIGMLTLVCIVFLIALCKSFNSIMGMNKKLLILVMGREKNIEGLRALVASEKPPQGNLRGIATKDKKDVKPKNTDYTMSIGLPKPQNL